jgi:hypothetical protein
MELEKDEGGGMKAEGQNEQIKKEEGRIKNQRNQSPFESFRIVTKIAVSSSASLRSGSSFAAETVPAAASSSNQYALSSTSRTQSPHFATN